MKYHLISPNFLDRSPLSPALNAYGRSQTTRLYATQFYTGLVIYFLGDLSAQSIRAETYDPYRTAGALIIGGLAAIPTFRWCVHFAAFLISSISLPGQPPNCQVRLRGYTLQLPSKTLSLLAKITISQIVFTPISSSFFFRMQSLLSGDSLPEIWKRIKRTVPTSFVNSCKIWPAATAFLFTFVGVQYRSEFLGSVAVGWQTYVSFFNRKVEDTQRRERAVSESEVGRGGR